MAAEKYKFTYLKYINDVSNSKIPTCKMVKLAVKRHIKDIKASEEGTFPYYFDHKKAQAAIIFFSQLAKTENLFLLQAFLFMIFLQNQAPKFTVRQPKKTRRELFLKMQRKPCNIQWT